MKHLKIYLRSFTYLFPLFCFLLLSGCMVSKRPQNSSKKTISLLLEELRYKDKDVRKQAAIRIGETGYGEKVKRALIAAFGDEDKEVRDAALDAMRFFAQRELLDIYLKKTADRNVEKRFQGIRALAYIDDRVYWSDERVLNALINSLKDENIQVVETAIGVFSKKKDARGIPYLVEFLLPEKDGKKRIKDIISVVARALTEINKPAVPFLIQRLADPAYEKASRVILDILFNIGEPVTDEIFQIYNKAVKRVRRDIVSFFARRVNDPLLEYILIDLLEMEDDRETARWIVRVMRNNNIKIGGIVGSALVYYLDDRYIHNEVIYTLIYKGINMVPDFIDIFRDTDNIIIKQGILEILAGINTPEAGSVLLNVMEEDEKSKSLILPYMTGFYDSRLAPVFIDVLKSNDLEMKEYAIRWLRRFGSRFVFQLLPLLHHPNKYVRKGTIAVLKKISHEAIVPYLLEVFKKEKDELLKVKIIEILGKAGSEEVVEILIEEMGKKKEMLETDAAAIALINIGRPAVPNLLRLLKDDKTYKSAYAAYVLARIGDRSAIDPIKDLIKQRSESGVKVYVKSSDPLVYSLEPVDAVKYSLSLLERGYYMLDAGF